MYDYEFIWKVGCVQTECTGERLCVCVGLARGSLLVCVSVCVFGMAWCFLFFVVMDVLDTLGIYIYVCDKSHHVPFDFAFWCLG